MWAEYGFDVKFRYITPHPTDYYKNIIEEIYNEPDAYHMDRGAYLSDLGGIMYEKFILSYEYFTNYNED